MSETPNTPLERVLMVQDALLRGGLGDEAATAAVLRNRGAIEDAPDVEALAREILARESTRRHEESVGRTASYTL